MNRFQTLLSNSTCAATAGTAGQTTAAEGNRTWVDGRETTAAGAGAGGGDGRALHVFHIFHINFSLT